MAAIDNQPLSYNRQEAQNFAFNVKRLPSVSYFCEKFQVPNVSLPAANAPSPSLNIPFPGDHVRYEPLVLTFGIDTNLQNWLEIYNWMTAIGNPTNKGNHYQQLENAAPMSPFSITSDISVFKMDSQRNPVMTVTFKNAWPTSLTGMDFVSTTTPVTYLTATATFRYLRYTFDPIVSYVANT